MFCFVPVHYALCPGAHRSRGDGASPSYERIPVTRTSVRPRCTGTSKHDASYAYRTYAGDISSFGNGIFKDVGSIAKKEMKDYIGEYASSARVEGGPSRRAR